MFSREEQRKEEKKMNIIDKRNRMKKFGEMAVGECFIDDDGDINIKIVDYNISETSAVCLKDGQQWHPDADGIHEIVTATLEIK